MKIRKRRISSLLSLLAVPLFATSLFIKSAAVVAQQANTIVINSSTEVADAEIVWANTSNVLQIVQQDFNVDPVETNSSNELDSSTTVGNSISIEQQGELNLLDLFIDSSQASITINQSGNNNQVSDESGAAMILVGDSVSLSILQTGSNNAVTGTMMNTNALGANTVSIIQSGDNNVASFSQR